LAVIALAAVFCWQRSYARPASVWRERWTIAADSVDWVGIAGTYASGRLGVVWGEQRHPKAERDIAMEEALRKGPGWTWESYPTPVSVIDPWGNGGLGPIHWSADDSTVSEPNGGKREYRWRTFSLPCWLLALLAGAWPLASVALLIRRRRRASRRRRLNLCRLCGYDLRATPSPDGALLAICPECGSARRDDVGNPNSAGRVTD
jgi:hypothetical protein